MFAIDDPLYERTSQYTVNFNIFEISDICEKKIKTISDNIRTKFIILITRFLGHFEQMLGPLLQAVLKRLEVTCGVCLEGSRQIMLVFGRSRGEHSTLWVAQGALCPALTP